jgi:hypothetical protein
MTLWLLASCNRAPTGPAAWDRPTDDACDDAPDAEEVSGFLWCDREDVLRAIDDPVYVPCDTSPLPDDTPAVSAFDGGVAKAWPIATLEAAGGVINDTFQGTPVVVAYDLRAQLGLFGRTVGDAATWFTSAGTWAGAGVLTERNPVPDAGASLYSTRDGAAFDGPATDLAPWPALLAQGTLADHRARHGSLPEGRCLIYDHEVFGVGCDTACGMWLGTCPDGDYNTCMAVCRPLPRADVDCIASIGVCELASCTGAPVDTGAPTVP